MYLIKKYMKKIMINLANKAGKPNPYNFVNNFSCALDFCLLVSEKPLISPSNSYTLKFCGIKLLTFPSLAKALERFFRGSLLAFYYKFDTNNTSVN